MYKFAPKCTNSRQNVQIPHYGEENVNIIPRRELLARKNLIFQPEEFSRDPAMPQLILPNSVSGKKRCGLVIIRWHWV